MNAKSSLEKCRAFINVELDSSQKPARSGQWQKPEPTITISQQAGVGGMLIAEHLAEYLQSKTSPTQRPWTVFDKNLVEAVLADHNLPRQLAQYMPEDRVSQIRDMTEELLGLHPSSWTLLRQTTETILHLAELGNVILVGRAANVITAKLENVFHVRLVGSAEARVRSLEKSLHLERKSALALMKKEDRGRKRYLKRYFFRNLDDPLLYHLIINTDRISSAATTRLVGDTVLQTCY